MSSLRPPQRWLTAAISAITIGTAISAGSATGLFRLLEWNLQDQLFQLRSVPGQDDRIAIVTVDEDDIAYLQQWPMSDQVMANLIDQIQAQSPQSIGLDFYRDLPVEPGHEALVRRFETMPNIIGVEKIAGTTIAAPPSLAAAGQVAANDLLKDADGKVRRAVVLLGKPDGSLYQGLGVRLALSYLKEQGIALKNDNSERQIYRLGQARFVPLREGDGGYRTAEMGGYQILLNYQGRQAQFPQVSLRSVLKGELSPELIRDRIVLLGAIAPSLNDNHLTPYNSLFLSESQPMPGVVIHANVASQVLSAALDGRPMLRFWPRSFDYIWIGAWTVWGAWLGSAVKRRWWRAVLATLASATFSLGVGVLAFQQGWMIPLFQPFFALGSATALSAGLARGRNLKFYVETLEAQVEDRTAELAQANQSISALNQQLSSENLRLGAELDLLQQMQRFILPREQELQGVSDLDIVGYMEPAEDIGGDYYDVLNLDGVITIAIGDVTGHGLESGLLMIMTQAIVRALQEIQEPDPVRVLDTLNRTLYKNIQRMGTDKNMTLAILNYHNGQASISGQHEEMLVMRADGQLECVDTTDLGLPIGLDDNITEFIDQISVTLAPGDGIVLYTDGIPEAYNLNKQQYGLERLHQILQRVWVGRDVETVQQAVIQDLKTFIGARSLSDDISLVVFKRKLTNSASASVQQNAHPRSLQTPVVQTFGDFIPDLDPNARRVSIGLDRVPREIYKDWSKSHLFAKSLGNYCVHSMLQTVGHRPDFERNMTEIEEALSYVLHELVENSLKFHHASHATSIELEMAWLQANATDQIILISRNDVDSVTYRGLVSYINELQTTKLSDLYTQQVEHSFNNDDFNISGLGLLTIVNDYSAKIGWKISANDDYFDRFRVSTMIQLPISQL